MSQNYEFSEQENKSFSGLYNRLNYFTILTVISGIFVAIDAYIVLAYLNSNIGALQVLGIGLFYVVLGVILRRPLDNIKNIITTKDKDISELMIVIDDFKQAFMVATVAGVVYLLILIWRTIALMLSGG